MMQKAVDAGSLFQQSIILKRVWMSLLVLCLTSCSGGTRGTAITHRRTIDGVVRTTAANPKHYSTVTVLETDSTTEVDNAGRFALFVDAPVTELNLSLSDGRETGRIFTLPSLSPSDSSLILVLNPDSSLNRNSFIETTTRLVGSCESFSTSVPEVQQQTTSEPCYIEIIVENQSASPVNLSLTTRSCIETAEVSESASTEELVEIASSQSHVHILPLESDSQVEAKVRFDELQQDIVEARGSSC